MSLLYNDDLACIDLGLQPAIDLRDLGFTVDLLIGQQVHHASIDGADSDFLGLLGFWLVGLVGSGLRLDVVGHGCAFRWGIFDDSTRNREVAQH